MKDNRAYVTYLPILLKLVEQTDGPILELGMGYSTMILDMMCQQTERELASYENDEKWYKENLIYKSNYHSINYVEDWDKVPYHVRHWSIALIDHRPAMRRRVDAMRLKDNVDYILIHDSEPEIDRFYGYSRLYKLFKYRYDYKDCKPNTTVLSNFIDLSVLDKK